METWLPIIIQVVAGLIGGNLAGSANKRGGGLGATLNTLLGALGGLGGGQLLGVLGVGGGQSSTDLMPIIANVVGGGAGGAILTAIAGMFKGGAKQP